MTAAVALTVAGTCMGAAQADPARLELKVTQSPAAMAAAAGATCKVNTVIYNRSEACQTVQATVRVTRNGKEIGRAAFTISHEMTLNKKSLKWSETTRVSKATITGSAGGISMGTSVSCGSPCKASSHVPRHTLGSAFSGKVDYNDGVKKNKIHSSAANYAFTFTKPGYTLGGFSYSSLGFRCDDSFWNAANTRRILSPGCVFPKYIPTLTTMSTLPEIAKNIRKIQSKGGHYGKPGSGHPLHRLTDDAKANANRRAVCGKAKPVPGKSCDEYPFARTHEGGTALPAASRGIAMVPATEQDKQGGRIIGFYKQERMMDKDGFWVAV
ncbi:NucA/NucB deoxyribonuclease domain-containing protein [Streptomyces sp. NPDC088183]|uniref:NucA/NucB deoxyribonuclease domain-containing protein n=1 Tax=Streptomyces sp. NPDC088183 TaxID=3160992 RepID=UPI0034361D23